MQKAILALVLALTFAAGCGGSPSPTAGTTSPSAARNGEESIEEFGREAEGQDRATLLDTFHTYLDAIETSDYPTVCSYFTAGVRRSLQQFAPTGGRHHDCKELLPALLAPSAATIARQEEKGRVTKVRVQGDRAFIVFDAPGAKLYMQALVREGGEWKTTTIAASVLAP